MNPMSSESTCDGNSASDYSIAKTISLQNNDSFHVCSVFWLFLRFFAILCCFQRKTKSATKLNITKKQYAIVNAVWFH